MIPKTKIPQSKPWLQLLLCLFVLWCFIFVIAPEMESIPSIKVLHECIEENNIDAGAIYYTDLPEFSTAEASIRDAMTY